MKFNKAKCKVLHLGQENPEHIYRLGRELTESSPEEEDFGVLVVEKLNMAWQCVLAAKEASCILGCMASRLREVILLHSGETPPGVLYPALELSAEERHGCVGVGPKEGHNSGQRAGAPLL